MILPSNGLVFAPQSPSAARGLTPNFTAWLQTAWGAGAEYCNTATLGMFASASNLVFGVNPPYYLDDFLAVYPKFFGAPTVVSGCSTTQGDATVAVPSSAGVLIGMFVVGADLPKGTTVVSTTPTSVTLSNAALDTNANATLQIYEAPPVPVAIVQLYLNLAAASLVQARWQDAWTLAMAWFIAHYLTLYARSDAAEVVSALEPVIHSETPTGAVPGTVYTLSAVPPGGVLDGLFINGLFQPPSAYALVGATITLTASTAPDDLLTATWATQITLQTVGAPSTAQLAAQGLLNGILTSKSVGDVSASYNVLDEQAGWGTFRLTVYGAQLVDMAKVIGSGPAVFW